MKPAVCAAICQAGSPLRFDQLTPEEQPDTADLLKGAMTALRSATREQAYVVANKVTAGRVQVRLGRDLLWYPYLSSGGDWEPAGQPHADPVRAIEVAGLAAAVDR